MNQSFCGLVSISFREHSPDRIVRAVFDAGLNAVEWGGDVHVPHGNEEKAQEVKTLSGKLFLPEYGSYYRIGQSDPSLFDKVLASARILGTPMIRVWAGAQSSDRILNDDYQKAVSDARRICLLAPETNICLECHPQTLTDEYHTALAFLHDVGCNNLKMFWQPNQFRSHAYNMDALTALLPYLTSVHVFTWKREKRLPLYKGKAEWKEYLSLLKTAPRAYMLEFMHDDRLETLKETAETLMEWLH